MLDNQLIQLVIETIIAGEAVAAIPGTPIKAAFQPTQQGANTAPTGYLWKIGDHCVGSPYRANIWQPSPPPGQMVHTETQQYETTFQISVLATQDPKNLGYTASDILNLIRSILQSTAAITTFEAQGVGILRILDVRNPWFIDDSERHEASPSLDFTLTHKQIVSTTIPVLDSEEFDIYAI